MAAVRLKAMLTLRVLDGEPCEIHGVTCPGETMTVDASTLEVTTGLTRWLVRMVGAKAPPHPTTVPIWPTDGEEVGPMR